MPEFVGNIADLAGFISAIGVVLIFLRDWRNAKRQNATISFVLWLGDGADQVTLPITVKRRELSRAEVLGRLGMLPMAEKGKRFSLAYLAKTEFLDQLDLVASGESSLVLIPATAAEAAQFDL